MAISHPIPIDVLRQLIRLDPETGRLYWLTRSAGMFSGTIRQSAAHKCAAWNARYAETEALTAPNNHGHRKGFIDSRHYYAHSVVFALVNGRWAAEIDHIDRDRGNNKPSNLREACRAENLRNKRSHGGSSKYKGVSWVKRRLRWQASAGFNGKKIFLGTYDTEEGAAKAYDRFATEHFGEFARLNLP